MTTFNAEAFEQTVIEQASQTAYVPVPEGDYSAYVDGYKFRVTKNDSVILDVTWIIPDQALEEQLGMESIQVRQSIFLSLTEAGALDFGINKNVAFGRLRQALGLNDGSFQFPQLTGQQATISVTQRADDRDSSIIYNDVAKVQK